MDPNEALNRTAAHCPSCGAEYRSGFDTCADCGVPLEPGPAPAAEDEVTDGTDDGSDDEPDPWGEATRRAWGDERGRDDHPEPAVVARLPLQEAMLLVGRLEEAGIQARVDADVTPYFVSNLNALKSVLVPRSRLEDATRVVEDVEAGRDRI